MADPKTRRIGCISIVAVLTLGLVGGAVAAYTIVPPIAEEKARTLLNEQVGKTIDADLTFGDVRVSLFKHFPDTTVTVTDIDLVGRGDFDGVHLAQIAETEVAFDVMSLIRGEDPILQRVELHQPQFDLRVSEAGVANWATIDSGSEEDTGSSMSIRLEDVVVRDLALRYDDASSGIHAEASGVALDGSASFVDDVADADATLSIGALTATAGGITWLTDSTVELDTEAAYTLATGGVVLGDTKLVVEQLPLNLSGSATPDGDDWLLDMAFDAPEATFGSVLSLVPDAYLSDLQGVKADGVVAANGTVKGRYASEGDTLPGFDLKLTASDAWFQYPDLPERVSDIAVDMAVRHPEGPTDLTEIDVNRLHLSMAGSPADVRMTVRQPVSDPLVDAEVKADLDLAAVSKAIADLDTSGIVKADFAVKGRMSDFEEQRVERVQASGGVTARNLTYRSEDLPDPVQVRDLDVQLSPQKADIRSLSVATGPSDAEVTGSVDNLWPYLMADKVLRGRFDVRSKVLDARPFQGAGDEGSEADDGESSVVAIPTDLDLRVDVRAGKVFFDDMVFNGLETDLAVKEGVADVQSLQAGFTGGRVNLHGTYAAPTLDHADIDFTIDTVELDAPETVETFATLKRIAPLVEGLSGTFDAKLGLQTRLLSDLSPELNTLASAGNLRDLTLASAPSVLTDIARKLKGSELSKVDLAGTVVAWNIEGGRMTLEPIDLKLGGTPATLKGSTGVVDQTLDLVLELPMSTRALAGTDLLGDLAGSVGTVDVKVKITGTWDKPKIALGVGDELEDAVADVVDDAKQEVLDGASDLIEAASARGDQLIAAAERAAASLRSEADEQADKLRRAAKRQGDKLVDAAKNPIAKAAAKESAKLLDREADKAADKVTREADKQADKLVDEAKQKKKDLVAEARAKVKNQR